MRSRSPKRVQKFGQRWANCRQHSGAVGDDGVVQSSLHPLREERGERRSAHEPTGRTTAIGTDCRADGAGRPGPVAGRAEPASSADDPPSVEAPDDAVGLGHPGPGALSDRRDRSLRRAARAEPARSGPARAMPSGRTVPGWPSRWPSRRRARCNLGATTWSWPAPL